MSGDSTEIEWMFYTKVVGVTHNNRNRKSRQKIIRDTCYPGQRLQLIPEPENRHDHEAVGVWTPKGDQIGYLSRIETASEMFYLIVREKKEVIAEVAAVTGGNEGRSYGVNIHLGVRKDSQEHESVSACRGSRIWDAVTSWWHR